MRSWNLVRCCVGFTILLFTYIFLFQGFNEESLRVNIRLSARIAAVFFAIAFIASSIQYFKKGLFTFWLLGNRKYFGITYAIIHIIHLGFLITLQYIFHPVFERADLTSLLGGGLAYLFTFFMLITSIDRFKNRLSHTLWKNIHTIGGYWIWSIFMISYIKRVDTEIEYLPMIIIFTVVLLSRLYKLIHKTFLV